MTVPVLIILAGLMGASGIMLAAAGAPATPRAGAPGGGINVVVPRSGLARRGGAPPAWAVVAAPHPPRACRLGPRRGVVLRRPRFAGVRRPTPGFHGRAGRRRPP